MRSSLVNLRRLRVAAPQIGYSASLARNKMGSECTNLPRIAAHMPPNFGWAPRIGEGCLAVPSWVPHIARYWRHIPEGQRLPLDDLRHGWSGWGLRITSLRRGGRNLRRPRTHGSTVETPQDATTNLPGVNRRGVSTPPAPRQPAARRAIWFGGCAPCRGGGVFLHGTVDHLRTEPLARRPGMAAQRDREAWIPPAG